MSFRSARPNRTSLFSLGSLSGQSQSQSHSIVAMGKIPSEPEFLQNRTTREPRHGFEAWLEAGMGYASHRYGSAFTDAFELGAVQGFVFRPAEAVSCETVLTGVLFPSCDAVGRHYPLTIASEVPEAIARRTPHVLPLAFGDFLERVHEATSDFPDLTGRELSTRLVSVMPPTEDELLRASAEYDEWCRSTPVEHAWSAIFPSDSLEMARLALDELGRLTAHTRGLEASRRTIALRLPLGEAGPAAASLWLDVVRRLAQTPSRVPCTFWGVESGSLLVALGDPTPPMVASVWLAGSEHEVRIGAVSGSLAPPSDATSVSSSGSPTSIAVGPRSAPSFAVPSDAPMSALLDALVR